MTLQLSLASSAAAGSLASLGFGPNEIASSLVIAKHIGSYFSRDENANLFFVYESHLGVRVTSVPRWLENVVFERTSMIMRGGLNLIRGPRSMSNVEMSKLEGVATFIVLVLKPAVEKSEIVSMLERLLDGKLGTIVSRGSIDGPALPYNLKPLLRSFVEATLDCDADCQQSNQARQWMAELAHATGAVEIKTTERFQLRRNQMAMNLLSELLGGPTVEDGIVDQRKHSTSSSQQEEEMRPARVHHTLSLHMAYIALAARANGAEVLVEVVTSTGLFAIPENAQPRLNQFCVRLWLTQPPLEVIRVFRFTESLHETAYPGSHDEESDPDADDDLVIFGGESELSFWAAQKVSFHGLHAPEHDRERAIHELWSAGSSIGGKCPWVVAEDPSRHRYPVVFKMDISAVSHETIPASAGGLVQMFSKRYPSWKTIARPVANALHRIYGFRSYGDEDLHESLGQELCSGMMLVCLAIAVQVLHRITVLPGINQRSTHYAFSLFTLKKDGALCVILDGALDSKSKGVKPSELLWAAATLWGGMSQTFVRHYDFHGIVGLYCTVILDMLRDPHTFVKDGMGSKLLRVLHGACPLLPRERSTGLMKQSIIMPVPSRARALAQKFWDDNGGNFSTSLAETLGSGDATREVPTPDMVITFEPFSTNPSCGVFCAWYQGNLAFELDIGAVFHNLLRQWKSMPRGLNRCLFNCSSSCLCVFTSRYYLIERMRLLELGQDLYRRNKRYGCWVFRGRRQSGWLVTAAGLFEDVAFCREIPEVQSLQDRLQNGRMVILFD